VKKDGETGRLDEWNSIIVDHNDIEAGIQPRSGEILVARGGVKRNLWKMNVE
jgi:hypothetical protein